MDVVGAFVGVNGLQVHHMSNDVDRFQILFFHRWSLNTYCPVPGPVPASPANNDYKPGFAAAMMEKDLKLAQTAAQSAGAATPMGAAALSLYRLFLNTGQGNMDFSGIIKMIRGN